LLDGSRVGRGRGLAEAEVLGHFQTSTSIFLTSGLGTSVSVLA